MAGGTAAWLPRGSGWQGPTSRPARRLTNTRRSRRRRRAPPQARDGRVAPALGPSAAWPWSRPAEDEERADAAPGPVMAHLDDAGARRAGPDGQAQDLELAQAARGAPDP